VTATNGRKVRKSASIYRPSDRRTKRTLATSDRQYGVIHQRMTGFHAIFRVDVMRDRHTVTHLTVAVRFTAGDATSVTAL